FFGPPCACAVHAHISTFRARAPLANATTRADTARRPGVSPILRRRYNGRPFEVRSATATRLRVSSGSHASPPKPQMIETNAQQKFACPSCGGEAIWNPAKQKLVCPFCGTESPAKFDATGGIVEHDLVAALRGITDDQRGWDAEKREVRCQS